MVCWIPNDMTPIISDVKTLWNNKTVNVKNSIFFFQILFIAQIQVAQQYSSLTTQNNSLAVTRKAWIHGMD